MERLSVISFVIALISGITMLVLMIYQIASEYVSSIGITLQGAIHVTMFITIISMFALFIFTSLWEKDINIKLKRINTKDEPVFPNINCINTPCRVCKDIDRCELYDGRDKNLWKE